MRDAGRSSDAQTEARSRQKCVLSLDMRFDWRLLLVRLTAPPNRQTREGRGTHCTRRRRLSTACGEGCREREREGERASGRLAVLAARCTCTTPPAHGAPLAPPTTTRTRTRTRTRTPTCEDAGVLEAQGEPAPRAGERGREERRVLTSTCAARGEGEGAEGDRRAAYVSARGKVWCEGWLLQGGCDGNGGRSAQWHSHSTQ